MFTSRTARVIRIYGIEPGLRSPFHPEARADELLGEAIVHLNAPDPNFFPVYPLDADVGDLGSIAPVGSRERIAVEVAPLTPELPIWAFIASYTVRHSTCRSSHRIDGRGARFPPPEFA